MRDSGLEQAIKAAGGISSLARAIGVAQPSVSNWSKVPSERVLAVEAITSVPRAVLRPDLYPQDSDDVLDAVEQARGQLYLLLANLLRDAPSVGTLREIAGLGQAGEGAIGAALAELARQAGATTAEAAAREHFTLFVGVGRGELVPFASYYRTGFLYERPLVKVREDLRILGVQRGDESGDPEDGIAFLCEVMAGMALRRFASAPLFERAFFNRHLAPWAEGFFADLERADAADFYRAVGRLGKEFIAVERDAFALDEASDQRGATARDEIPEDRHDRKAS